MENYTRKTYLRLFLLLFATAIGVGSLLYTNRLAKILSIEERKKVELWAKATERLVHEDDEQVLNFLLSIIENNNTVPVILADENGTILSAANFEKARLQDTLYLQRQYKRIKSHRDPIPIDLGNGVKQYIYYRESTILSQLIVFPYIQLGIIFIFLLIAYQAFSSSQKAEKNHLWISMSKETAHQLGTPTSSLSGWVELLQEKYPDLSITKEINLDVERLSKITERFSSIGTRPALKQNDIIPIIINTICYLQTRASSKVKFIIDFDDSKAIIIPVNTSLFEWVIENITKNAIDAMEGKGEIRYAICETVSGIIINITDTGKGIGKKYHKAIFKPGYTTKQHGWGLGLSLAKRIIEDFHNGKLYVNWSEPGKGTCISIALPCR